MPRRRLDDDVPRLPRGRGLTLPFGQVLRIAVVAVALVALIVLQRPCSRSVSRFVMEFAPQDAAVAPQPIPQGVHIRTDMTPAEIEAAIARAKAEAAGTAVPDAGAAVPDAGAALPDAPAD